MAQGLHSKELSFAAAGRLEQTAVLPPQKSASTQYHSFVRCLPARQLLAITVFTSQFGVHQLGFLGAESRVWGQPGMRPWQLRGAPSEARL